MSAIHSVVAMHTSAGKRTGLVWLGIVGIGIALGIGSTIGAPRAQADATVDRPSQTRDALDALTQPSSAAAQPAMPEEFTERFYTPTIEDGLLVNPDGDCSSPIPLPSEFEIPCKAHDLGYDLLRFGGDAARAADRKDLDNLLGIRMHERCSPQPDLLSRSSCHVMADVAVTAVRFNSWRQHFGVPAPEPALPYLIAGSIGVTVVGLAACGLQRRIRFEQNEVTA